MSVQGSARRGNDIPSDDAGAILTAVTDLYLTSHAFNGMPLSQICASCGLSAKAAAVFFERLVQEGNLSLNYGDRHPNPYIMALPPEPPDVQIGKLRALGLSYGCAYPGQAHLIEVVDRTQYQGRPFTLRLALGEPQLTFMFFDLSVLEIYRNDPRYHYSLDGIWGHIGVTDKFYGSSQMLARDQVSLQSFGVGYDSEGNRAVAALLWDLSELSPEHQQIWNARRVDGDFRVHEAYFRSQVLGEWAEGQSIFVAFTEELRMINELCGLIVRPPLFKSDFAGERLPTNFCFILRPTAKECREFVHLLDKMLSENMNREFFGGDVVADEERERRGGRAEMIQKRTIRLLEEWIAARYRIADDTPIRAMIQALKDIRRERQRPAHAIDDNIFDQEFVRKQRSLIEQAYRAVNTLRLIFSRHPKGKGYRPRDWIDQGHIYVV